MRIPFLNCGKAPQKKQKPTAEGVILSELKKAYDIHPVRVMPSAVVAALDEAGFTIISYDDLDNEIALAHQAGVENGVESVYGDER